jgi:hypothetical protein
MRRRSHNAKRLINTRRAFPFGVLDLENEILDIYTKQNNLEIE